ncbi:AAA family ATPase [Kitasatospora aureofaciens]|uniref:AAA family ATPase n=1 Tax=Kitasatospora aureofaciens TaxID=1894 RepID=UPI0018E39AE5|nr:AAA family ATPase [Kitasatospora aureofaciens]
MNEVHLPQGDAFAKGGRERYGLTPRTWQDFAACLRQSADPSVPLPARAARAYLHIAFIHPYPDSNARLALLVLAHALEAGTWAVVRAERKSQGQVAWHDSGVASATVSEYIPPAARAVLVDLLAGARAGRGGAAVVRGEAGIGKTTLLRHVTDGLSGVRLLWVNGAEFEADFAYAAVHQLTRPLHERIGGLPAAQRNALAVALGLGEGGTPSRFAVGLALLGLLSDAAREQSVVCVVDDAQWLDRASAQALAFVARRVANESVAFVFGVRDAHVIAELEGLPVLTLPRLSDQVARRLLASSLLGPVDDQVRERILAEARGNPLALLELPRRLGPAVLAGGFGLPTPVSPASRIEQSYQQQVSRLSEDARVLLLVAAAEPLGDPGLLWRAADLLGVGPQAGPEAEASELIELGGQSRFRHPLVRSAVYTAASPAERRRVHGALAQVTDPLTAPDRRSWHRAQSLSRPDEEVAADLLRCAERARRRGGAAAEAAFLEQATGLTAEPRLRAERSLAAARAAMEAGSFESALTLVEAAEGGPIDATGRVQAELLRGRAAFFGDGAADAVGHLVAAADLDPGRARTHLLDALQAGLVVGRSSPAARDALAAARRAPAPAGERSTADELLDALVGYLDGDLAVVPVLLGMLSDVADPLWAGRLSLAALLAVELWDVALEDRLAGRAVDSARAGGTLMVLPVGLWMQAMAAAQRGDLLDAAALNSEADGIAEVTGVPPHWYGRLFAAAVRGVDAEARPLFDRVLAESHARRKGMLTATVHAAAALHANGVADHRAALASARLAVADGDLGTSSLALPELVEAAVRCGEQDTAQEAFARLSRHASAAGTDWALGVRAALAALLSDDPAELHAEAVARLDAAGLRVWRGRALLHQGAWLRRDGRRGQAREALRTAHELFTAVGAEGFAERARVELAAAGEQARPAGLGAVELLTGQELNIARLVATGATSREVADRLFLSPRTIDAHLRSVFRKLDVTSRRQLADVLGRDA